MNMGRKKRNKHRKTDKCCQGAGTLAWMSAHFVEANWEIMGQIKGNDSPAVIHVMSCLYILYKYFYIVYLSNKKAVVYRDFRTAKGCH